MDKWMTESTITVDGKKISIAEYLGREEAKESYSEVSGEYREANRKRRKVKPGTTPKMYLLKKPSQKKVLATRKLGDFSPSEIAEIKRQHQIKEENMAEGLNNTQLVIRNILERHGQWCTTKDYSEGLDMKQSSISSIMTRLWQFMQVEDLMIRKREKKGFIYLFRAEIDSPKAEIIPLYKKFLEHERGRLAKSKSKSNPKPQEKVAAPTVAAVGTNHDMTLKRCRRTLQIAKMLFEEEGYETRYLDEIDKMMFG